MNGTNNEWPLESFRPKLAENIRCGGLAFHEHEEARDLCNKRGERY